MRRALLLALVALALVGCSKPLSYYAPTVEVVTVWPRDQRPEQLRTRGGIGGLLLPLIPLVPYGTRETQTFQEQILSELGDEAATTWAAIGAAKTACGG